MARSQAEQALRPPDESPAVQPPAVEMVDADVVGAKVVDTEPTEVITLVAPQRLGGRSGSPIPRSLKPVPVRPPVARKCEIRGQNVGWRLLARATRHSPDR
jgi:hypothetical protein